mmetsp:Transcript_11068/g.20015  ORF Transcript_11068/g.20015 Transcript_11068/m.20015 type:complete len:239 (-) Transcript_11068:205-921(-)
MLVFSKLLYFSLPSKPFDRCTQAISSSLFLDMLNPVMFIKLVTVSSFKGITSSLDSSMVLCRCKVLGEADVSGTGGGADAGAAVFGDGGGDFDDSSKIPRIEALCIILLARVFVAFFLALAPPAFSLRSTLLILTEIVIDLDPRSSSASSFIFTLPCLTAGSATTPVLPSQAAMLLPGSRFEIFTGKPMNASARSCFSMAVKLRSGFCLLRTMSLRRERTWALRTWFSRIESLRDDLR